ncbi:MAG: oligosaccharide flippase family protein [Phaeodactylibacter sp.]|nr:oligosaccharide flippase family protein [Phaeodactylibacter sp.]
MSGSKSSMGNFLTMVVLIPITITVNIIVARILGPSAKGIYAFMMLMGESMVPILFLGFGVGVVYLIGSERFSTKESAVSCLLIGLLKGCIISALLYFLWMNNWLGETAAEIEPQYMLPVIFSLPLSGVFSIAKQVFKGSSMFKLLNIITLVDAVLNAVFLVFFVMLTKWGLQGAVIAIVAQKIFTTSVILYIIQRSYKPNWRIHMPFIRESYSYGIRAWVGNMATRANDRFDQLLLGFFANSTLLGYYSVAFSLVRFLGFFPQAVTPVFFNVAARQQDPEKSAQLLAQVHRAMIIMVGGLALLLGLTAYWLIVTLYGIEYEPAYVPFLILLPGMFIYSASRRVINKYLGANGMPGKTSIVQASGALTGIVLYLILIPSMDIVGAAIGSTVAYIVSSALAYYFFIQVMPQKRLNLFLVGPKDFVWIYKRVMGSADFMKKIAQRFRGKK